MAKDLMIANIRRWVCPYGCSARAHTNEARPHQRFHLCPVNGLTVPLVEEGAKVKVFAVEREDYVGKELVQKDNKGRPVMSVKTEHADGRTDVAVLAPHVKGEGRI